MAAQAAATSRYGMTSSALVTTVVNRPLADRADKMVMTQPARPAPAPVSADLATVATARASAHTAVIGTSQPKVTSAACPETADASKPSTAFSANTASARVSSTIRSLIAMLADSSQAGSIPGPYE